MRCKDKKLWKAVAGEEMTSLAKKNKMRLVVDKHERQKIIQSKWILKFKLGIPGFEPKRYTSGLVGKGYAQCEGINYQEVCSPVLNISI